MPAEMPEYDWDVPTNDKPRKKQKIEGKEVSKEKKGSKVKADVKDNKKSKVPNSVPASSTAGKSSSSSTPSSSTDADASTTIKSSSTTSVPISSFDMSPAMAKALKNRGIESFFPIQALTFPHIRKGLDCVGRARTGQGKTLAFAVPILEQLMSKSNTSQSKFPKVLVMSPTRELAKQTVQEFLSVCTTSQYRVEAIYGGTSLNENFTVLTKRGVDIIVGTPGRIKDVIDKEWLQLHEIEHVVLDEADQMLELGFKDEMTAVFEALNKDRNKGSSSDKDGSKKKKKFQTLLFSATMPQWINALIDNYLDSDKKIIDLVQEEKNKAVTTVEHIAVPCFWTQLGSTINDIIGLYGAKDDSRVMIFCETKADCDTIAMDKAIKHDCHVLHGDIPQAKREATLAAYKKGNFRVLVCTDVAARGLDLSVDLVIQAKPPIKLSGKPDVEAYVHRSGRTGRAGASGLAVTLFSPKTKFALEAIEKSIGNKMTWRGALQTSEVLSSTSQRYVNELTSISPSVFPLFQSTAVELIERMGSAELALCAALAKITGILEKPKEKSLLGSQEGYVTCMFHSGREIPSNGYVFGALNKRLPPDVVQSVRGMKLSLDKKNAVFDLPENHLEVFNKAIDETEGFQCLSICTELPELQPTQPTEDFRSGFGGGRGGIGMGGGRGFGRGGGRDGGRGVGGRDGGRGRGDYWGGRGGRGGGRGEGESSLMKRKRE